MTIIVLRIFFSEYDSSIKPIEESQIKIFKNLEKTCAPNFCILKYKFSQLNEIISVPKSTHNLNTASQWALSVLFEISFEVVPFNMKQNCKASRHVQQTELQMAR